MTNDVIQYLLETYGPLGVFLASFLGNAIPYSTIPYLFLVIIYASRVKDPYLNIVITILGGLGAALGKLVVYYIGKGVRVIISEKTKENMKLFVKFASKGIFLAVFLFAALPLPDDILYVPLGVVGYNIVKYFIALATGKIVITGLAVFFGRILGRYIEEVRGYPAYISVPILILITFIITYLVVKIDWVKAAEIASTKGLLASIKFIIINSAKIIKELIRGFILRLRRLIHPHQHSAYRAIIIA